MIELSRKFFFSCSLYNNKTHTGLNLVLEVFFKGKVDKTSNLVINFFNIDDFLKNNIKDWDHKEFVDTSFSDLANVFALDIKKNWPFNEAELSKLSISVTEPFKKVEIFF
ncbi:MAG: hypothetical protein HAW60_05630 [Bdellovibrionales bacterium]|nr:hypothetical protein [Bdellovibrionales bacterium]